MYKYLTQHCPTIPKATSYKSLLIIQKILLALLSGSILSLAFLNHELYYCAWFGFIPLLLAIEKTTLLQSYLIGLIAGLTLFTTAAYWIIDFIELSKNYGINSGYLLAGLFWFYSAHVIALATTFFKWFKQQSKVHEFLLFPLTFVFFASTFPLLFPMRLGDTQVNFQSALQAIEFVGVYGLDAIILLFNIVLYRVMVNVHAYQTKGMDRSKLPLFLSSSIIAAWFLYGITAYSSWQSEIATWETLKVGLVQVNERPSLGNSSYYPGYSQAYPPEMDMTERLNSAGADVIIWPEAQKKNYLDGSNIKRAYQKRMQVLNNHLIFQDMQHIHDPINGTIIEKYNSAIMINNQGQHADSYQKIKRIPFGEYTPMLEKDSIMADWVNGFFGGFFDEFNSELSQGETHTVFNHPKVNIIPLICYETTFPEFVANAVNNTSTTRELNNGAMLVGLSNDGWFGSSHLPYQHIMPSALRAVENRLPLVHVANNGPSIVVTPDGNVIFTSKFQQAAGYVVDVPHSNMSQGSFYSRYPALLTDSFVILFLIIMGLALKQRILRKITAHSLE
ncbi:MAG: apolipoprotein N-acyltransferase [Bermanella sp.]